MPLTQAHQIDRYQKTPATQTQNAAQRLKNRNNFRTILLILTVNCTTNQQLTTPKPSEESKQKHKTPITSCILQYWEK